MAQGVNYKYLPELAPKIYSFYLSIILKLPMSAIFGSILNHFQVLVEEEISFSYLVGKACSVTVTVFENGFDESIRGSCLPFTPH